MSDEPWKFFAYNLGNQKNDLGNPVFYYRWSNGQPMNLGLSTALSKFYRISITAATGAVAVTAMEVESGLAFTKSPNRKGLWKKYTGL